MEPGTLSDPGRLAALRRTGLSSRAVPSFDRLARLVADVLDVPTALVSLVDDQRQFFPGAAGLGEPWSQQRETPLTHSFCQHVVTGGEPLVVENALTDERVAGNLAIPILGVQAYAGYPLRSPDGSRLGALCAIDGAPRRWSSRELALLAELAEAVESELALNATRTQLGHEAALVEAVLESLDVAIIAFDPGGVPVRENAAARRTPGLLDVLLGPRSLVPRWLAGERLEPVVVEVGDEPTDAQHFNVRLTPMTGDAGEDLGVVATLTDVTYSVRTGRRRTALTGFADLLVADDPADSLAAALEYLARTLHWRDVVLWSADGADLAATVALTQRVRSTDLAALAIEQGRTVWDTHDGLRRTAAPVTTAAGEVLAVLETLEHEGAESPVDPRALLGAVTAHLSRFLEQRRVDALRDQLARDHELFENALSQINDVVGTVEVLPDGGVVPVYLSRNALAVLGVQPGLDLGDLATFVRESIHDDDLATVDGFFVGLNEHGTATVEVRLQRPDGVEVWMWLRGRTRSEEGRTFIDGTMTDVTERHLIAREREELLERERQQVQRLTELDRTRTEFIATISHELRTPVTVVHGYTELALDDPDLPPGVRTTLELMLRRTSHLAHVVEDVFDHAQLEAGLVRLVPVEVDFDAEVAAATREHLSLAAAESVAVTTELGSEALVSVDVVRLRQVLDNVVGNALKYTPAGGRVVVATSVRGDRVVLEVADTGIGIGTDEYDRIFERHYRSDTARQHGISGTGFGLAIAKAIVEAHGGAIHALPAEGGGLLVSIDFPLP